MNHMYHFLLLNDIPLKDCSGICVSMHLSVNTWDLSSLNKTAMNEHSLCGDMLSFFLNKQQGLGLLAPIVTVVSNHFTS